MNNKIFSAKIYHGRLRRVLGCVNFQFISSMSEICAFSYFLGCHLGYYTSINLLSKVFLIDSSAMEMYV